MTAAVAIEGSVDVAIVGARAEKRSVKKSATVFAAWRQMLYSVAEEWEEHSVEVEEKWHFNTAPCGESSPRAYALAMEGQQVSVSGVIHHLVEAVCASLLEHGPQVPSCALPPLPERQAPSA